MTDNVPSMTTADALKIALTGDLPKENLNIKSMYSMFELIGRHTKSAVSLEKQAFYAGVGSALKIMDKLMELDDEAFAREIVTLMQGEVRGMADEIFAEGDQHGRAH